MKNFASHEQFTSDFFKKSGYNNEVLIIDTYNSRPENTMLPADSLSSATYSLLSDEILQSVDLKTCKNFATQGRRIGFRVYTIIAARANAVNERAGMTE